MYQQPGHQMRSRAACECERFKLVTLGYRQPGIYYGTAPGSLVGDYPAALQELYSLFSSIWGLRRTVEEACNGEAGSIGLIRLPPFV